MSFVEWLDRRTPPEPPPPTSAVDVIAEALRIDADDAPDSWARTVWPHRAEVALAALEAAGYGVVKLPEVERDQYGDPIIPVPLRHRDGYLRIEAARTNSRGEPIAACIHSLVVPTPIQEGDAASFATALLAADRWLAAAREADNA